MLCVKNFSLWVFYKFGNNAQQCKLYIKKWESIYPIIFRFKSVKLTNNIYVTRFHDQVDCYIVIYINKKYYSKYLWCVCVIFPRI